MERFEYFIRILDGSENAMKNGVQSMSLDLSIITLQAKNGKAKMAISH
jgi:hypothetical protein